MSVDDKYDKRFLDLIQKGEQMLQKCGWDGQDYARKFPPDDEYNQWYASTKNLIEKVCGAGSNHYGQCDDIYVSNSGNSYHMPGCLGVLKAAYEDFKLGMLDDARILMTAEVFTDFVEQAEYLHAEHYRLPAAVLAGAVLEDSLRILCVENNINLDPRPKLETMNVALCKASVYNMNMQKQVTAWVAIRNSAAHCKESEFSEADVKSMIDGIVNFNATYLR